MSKAQKAHADDAEKSGIPLKATVELMSREVGGRENLGFLSKDFKNYIHRKRKMQMQKGDAGAILQYFQKRQADDSSYFYSMQPDEDDMITNIFWADARSVSDYGLFGDVICFDTTYRTNEYGRPFAPFVGINHHKQTVVFGVALLYDETVDSFKWLFETFLVAMSRKRPKTILTDQSAAIAKAILEVFPEAHHRLCVWHIYQNAGKNLSHVCHGSKEFCYDLSRCVYDYEEEDEWLFAWDDMLEKYELKENKWLKELFEVREKWALVYGRHTFTAQMMSTQRSESMNSVLKKYLMPSYYLLRFFEHYERVLADRRYEELISDFKMMHTTPILLTNADILQHAVEVYTPKVFKLFEKEYMGILNCSIYKVGKSGMTCEYKVCFGSKAREHLVKFDALTQIVTCSCMKFSFVGILCSHALKVLDKKNFKKLPQDYILSRWTRDAKARSISNYQAIEINENPKESVGKRYSPLCRNFREIASLAAEHEKLTAYAHERSIDLLKGLEEMKKNIGHDNPCVNQNLEGSTFLGGGEQVEKIINPRGVKRKATVGRSRGRFKDSLEKQKRTCQKGKPQELQPKKRLPMEDHALVSGSSKVKQVIGNEYSMFDSSTQDTNTGARDTVSSQNFGASTILEDVMPLTQLLEGSYIDIGSHVSFSNQTFGATATLQDDMSFTQLLQEALVHPMDLSKSHEGGKEFGNLNT